MSFRHTELTPLTEEALLRVNARLAARTFMVGGALSLADLVLFDTVHRAVVRHSCGVNSELRFLFQPVATQGNSPVTARTLPSAACSGIRRHTDEAESSAARAVGKAYLAFARCLQFCTNASSTL